MKLQNEKYKGYAISFVEKIIGPNKNVSTSPTKVVQGTFKSKVTGKILGDSGNSKADVLSKCKRMIDREAKIKGL